uniref:Sushi, von Willebrand factor type A, EGF and pentraxin domain-containing protein 1 n=1 Tax=Macrostomum lignano TaxID=282301 RepID=A0A1I8GVC5_9PLAT
MASALTILNERFERDTSRNSHYRSSAYCSPKPGAFSSNCPKQSCSTIYDCKIRDVPLICVCDKELCGSVCVPPDAGCEGLAEVPNGNKTRAISGNENRVGQTVTYICNSGYRLIGSSTVTCKANFKWTVPKERRGRCVPASGNTSPCGRPKVQPHTILDPAPDVRKSTYSDGEMFSYTCAPGYTAAAPGLTVTAVCSNGQWNIQDLACSCQVRTCEASGHWSGNLPSCNTVRCPDLDNPANGYTKAGRNTVNSVAEYFCNPGYRLNGHNKRLCRRDGTWDGSDPTCSIQDCGPPPFVPNALRPIYSSTTFGSTVAYTCMDGTKFEGENAGRIVCQNSGQWLPAPPRCRKHCDSPTIPHARVYIGRAGGPIARGKVPSDTTLNVQCREEYQLKTVYYPRCNNGSWTRLPKCIPKDCNDRPPIVKNGIARFYSTRHNDRAMYSCYVGYEMSSGSSSVVCRYGKWAGSRPVCTKKRCPWINSEPNVAKWLLGPEGQKNPWTRPETLSDSEELVKFECTEKGHAHPVIPKLYVQEWRQDMRNRELINTNAAIGMIPNHEHDDSLYLDRREQLVYNVEERARVDSKYEVPPREAMMKPPNHSSHSRYKSSLVTLSK